MACTRFRGHRVRCHCVAGERKRYARDFKLAAVAARGSRRIYYYRWSKDFLEAVKKRRAGDTARASTSDEVKILRREAMALEEVVADLTLENRVLIKRGTADGEDGE
jgi:hypothetical protein